jgi:hypothetical protein
MFDQTIALTSTDKSVTLSIKAGTEGVKSITLDAAGRILSVTTQQLIDLCAPALEEFASRQPD